MRKPKQESFGTFLYNKAEGTVMGRTGSSWGKIGVFYVIFYSFLAVFFSINMAVFYQTLDTEVMPTYTPGAEGGSILQNAALGYRPLPMADNIESTLVWFNHSDPTSIAHWVKSNNDFLAPYNESAKLPGTTYIDCSESVKPAAGSNEVCDLDLSALGDACSSNATQYGYADGAPCIFLKLNKMINWEPEVYATIDELDEDMPQDLKDHITEQAVGGVPPKMIWMSCEGKYPPDVDTVGPITMLPHRGFPAYYFPYVNTPGYRAPIISLEFTKPEPNVVINVECKMWAKNVEHNRSKRFGLIDFELLVD